MLHHMIVCLMNTAKETPFTLYCPSLQIPCSTAKDLLHRQEWQLFILYLMNSLDRSDAHVCQIAATSSLILWGCSLHHLWGCSLHNLLPNQQTREDHHLQSAKQIIKC